PGGGEPLEDEGGDDEGDAGQEDDEAGVAENRQPPLARSLPVAPVGKAAGVFGVRVRGLRSAGRCLRRCRHAYPSDRTDTCSPRPRVARRRDGTIVCVTESV